jgi:hypothetical protein
MVFVSFLLSVALISVSCILPTFFFLAFSRALCVWHGKQRNTGETKAQAVEQPLLPPLHLPLLVAWMLFGKADLLACYWAALPLLLFFSFLLCVSLMCRPLPSLWSFFKFSFYCTFHFCCSPSFSLHPSPRTSTPIYPYTSVRSIPHIEVSFITIALCSHCPFFSGFILCNVLRLYYHAACSNRFSFFK